MPMNYVKTAMLLAALTAIFVALGAAIGGTGGMVIAFFVALAMNVFSLWNADKLVLRMYNAHEVDERSAEDFAVREAEDVLSRAVAGRDASVEPGREQAASHRLDDALVEGAKVGEAARRRGERGVAAPLPVGEVGREDRDAKDRDDRVREVQLQVGQRGAERRVAGAGALTGPAAPPR